MASDKDLFGASGLEQFFERLGALDGDDWLSRRNELQSAARDWQRALESSRHTALSANSRDFRASKRDYDDWIADIFHATETAIPIEGLLRDFSEQFSKVHQTGPHGHGSTAWQGPWLVVVAGYPPQGDGDWQFQALTQSGMTENQWQRLKDRIARASANPLLQGVFSGRIDPEDLELTYLPYVRELWERGLFDDMLQAREGSGLDFCPSNRMEWQKARPDPDAYMTPMPMRPDPDAYAWSGKRQDLTPMPMEWQKARPDPDAYDPDAYVCMEWQKARPDPDAYVTPMPMYAWSGKRQDLTPMPMTPMPMPMAASILAANRPIRNTNQCRCFLYEQYWI